MLAGNPSGHRHPRNRRPIRAPGVKPCARRAKTIARSLRQAGQASYHALPWKTACVMRGAMRLRCAGHSASAGGVGRADARNVPPGASRTSSSARTTCGFRRRCGLLRPRGRLDPEADPGQGSTACRPPGAKAGGCAQSPAQRRQAPQQQAAQARAPHRKSAKSRCGTQGAPQQRQAEDAAKGKNRQPCHPERQSPGRRAAPKIRLLPQVCRGRHQRRNFFSSCRASIFTITSDRLSPPPARMRLSIRNSVASRG